MIAVDRLATTYHQLHYLPQNRIALEDFKRSYDINCKETS
jgi:hypothetical protein